MKNRLLLRAKNITVFLSFVILIAETASAEILSLSLFDQYNYNSVTTVAFDSNGRIDPGATDFKGYWYVNSLDGSDRTYTATAAGSVATMTTNDSAPDANTAIFKTTWNFVRAANAQFGNETIGTPSVSFLALEDLHYKLVGSFSNSGGLTAFDVRIADRTDQVLGVPGAADPLGPFLSYQSSSDPISASFVLESGALTGTLFKGHYYSFNSQAASYGGPDDGAVASGDVSLTLTGVNAVPEPSAVLLSAAGLCLMLGAKRIRKSDVICEVRY